MMTRLMHTRDLYLLAFQLVEGGVFATALLFDPRKEKHLVNPVASGEM
jgi:hypothetical protein